MTEKNYKQVWFVDPACNYIVQPEKRIATNLAGWSNATPPAGMSINKQEGV